MEIAHDFYLGIYEVTQEEWEKVTGKNQPFPGKPQSVPSGEWDRTVRYSVLLNAQKVPAGNIVCPRKSNGNTPAGRP
jgi:formylglycine-generating enzyme required for sulfatase activity